MYKYSEKSKSNLATCDSRLQTIFNFVIKYYDCSIICGHRGESDQNNAFASGNSQLKFPYGKHNKIPSLAIDVHPYPKPPEDDFERYYHFAGFVQAVGLIVGIKIRWGGDFNGDKKFSNEKFKDLMHFEIVE